MTVEWTMPQACLWWASHDEAQVSSLRRNVAFIELAVLADLDKHDNIGSLHQGWIGSAQDALRDAMRTGAIKAVGCSSLDGTKQEIPAYVCGGGAQFFLNRYFRPIMDEPKADACRAFGEVPEDWDRLKGEMEAAEDGECFGDPAGLHWTNVRLLAADVRRVWPKPAIEPVSPEQAQHVISSETASSSALPATPMAVDSAAAAPTTTPVAAPPQVPTYTSPETYSADKVPDQFTKWAESERKGGRLITESSADCAMRGSKDANGPRRGALLKPGPKLSRQTIRGWIKRFEKDHPGSVAKRGTPPSRR
jgi:hypothetical protein